MTEELRKWSTGCLAQLLCMATKHLQVQHLNFVHHHLCFYLYSYEMKRAFEKQDARLSGDIIICSFTEYWYNVCMHRCNDMHQVKPPECQTLACSRDRNNASTSSCFANFFNDRRIE